MSPRSFGPASTRPSRLSTRSRRTDPEMTMNRKTILLMTALAALVGCEKKKAEEKPVPPAPERADVQYMTPVQHLIRISMDLRGTRPTIGELNDIEANPDKIEKYIDAYMADPRFAEKVKE